MPLIFVVQHTFSTHQEIYFIICVSYDGFYVGTHVSPLQKRCTCRFSRDGDGVRKREKRCSEQVLTAEHGEILSELVPDWMEEQRLLDALTINHPERPV